MIDFDTDILKHFVRTQGWLPACKRRLKRLRAGRKSRYQRPLRYFTFCAVGAIDVLMLDIARIVSPSKNGRFDTVCFFDRSREAVIETQKRIPGAIGFPGEFVRTVLRDDPDEALLAEGATLLMPPEHAQDERQTREQQVRGGERREFIRQFPFDAINLDLEQFMFKPSQPMPGELIRALRKLLEWQRLPLRKTGLQDEHLAEFTLMFTTQVGPQNMGNDYLEMLTRRIDDNLTLDQDLKDILVQRTGSQDARALRAADFELFFEFAVPKVLMHTLAEQDWHVDPTVGLKVFEFERESQNGPYRMLHFVMDVLRNSPPLEQRAPGDRCEAAENAYRQVAKDVFRATPIQVIAEQIDLDVLRPTLDEIKLRRKRYHAE